MKSLLCIDIGTSSIKGGVINESGTLEQWNRVSLYAPSGEDFNHWDPLHWVDAIGELIAGLGKSAPGRAVQGKSAQGKSAPARLPHANLAHVSGVAVSGNGPTVVPVDDNGTPSYEALLWLDKRNIKIDDQPSFFLPKVKWFSVNQPGLYERTNLFFSCPEYICYLLTGEAVTITPSGEFSSYIWDSSGIEAYGLDKEKFPPFVPVTHRIGTVQKKAEEKFGIKAGTPVYASGSDFLMSLLGTAAVVPGRTCDRAGTSEGINYCSRVEIGHPRLRCLPHVIEGYYNVAGILASTGRVFEWFRKISGQLEKPYRQMFEEIEAVAHKENFPRFFPSLHRGPVWDFSGGAFTGLEPYHEAPCMGKAVVEAIGFAVKDLIYTLEENNCRIDELRVSGGQARNVLWNRKKADITGKQIVVPAVVDAELLGNAAAGFTGAGLFSTLTEAAETLFRAEEVYEPRREEFEYYESAFATYQEMCRRILTII